MEPGKTAPRLLEDLLSYDPRTASTSKNLLADPAPIWDETQVYVPRRPKNSCRHQYTIKHLQSVLPLLDTRPEQDTKWRVASVCSTCRCHLTMTIDFGGSSWKIAPCPITNRPLHFFVLLSRREPQDPWVSEDIRYGRREREYCFKCTARRCQATLRITVSPARLTAEQISLLTDSRLLVSRYEAAVASDSTRNFEKANGALVLHRLRIYLRDGLDTKSGKSQFPKKNKSFMVSFGEECDEILRSLGFADAVNDEKESAWRIPKPPPKEDAFDQTSHRAFLEDIVEELGILILNKPAFERKTIQNLNYQHTSARRDFERILDMLDCKLLEPNTVASTLIVFVQIKRPRIQGTTISMTQSIRKPFLSSLLNFICVQSAMMALQLACDMSACLKKKEKGKSPWNRNSRASAFDSMDVHSPVLSI